MSEQPIHVLLVEDDLDHSKMIQWTLQRQSPSVRVTAVPRGEDCLKMLRRNSYAAVFLDYNLPGMDGLAVLREIRQRGLQIPIIMVTGQGDERVAVEAIKGGASDYLIKTSGYMTTLHTVLFKVLRQHELAMVNVRLYEETQRNLERMRALREIDMAMTSTLDLRTVLDVLLEKMDLLLPYSTATIGLFNKESGLLEPVACRNLDEQEWRVEKQKAGRGMPNVVFETKAPVMIANVRKDPRTLDREFFRKHGLVSYLGVPLIAKSEVLGVLSFYTKEEHEFSQEEVEFFSTLAGHAAMAIQNSQLFEETKRQAAELKRSNKVKDEFLSVMSHELRTPLNVVMGYTGMIRDGLLGEVSPEQERVLEKVISRTRDQLTMISSILQAVQMDAEGVRVERREVSLRDFFNDLKVGYALPLRKELSIVWDYPLDLPVINTDSEKLKHVLQNLVNNAIKFTEKGHVTISARVREGNRHQAEGSKQDEKRGGADGQLPTANYLLDGSAVGRGSVEFKVTDTGVGIPEEALPIIFERFRQVDSSETRRFGGVGIGLYIVKEFTELLGGEVAVESEPGKGSTFTVTIPCDNVPFAAERQKNMAVSS